MPRVAQALHLVGCVDAEQGEAVAQHLPDRDDQGEARLAQPRVVDEKALGSLVTVEFLRQILQVVSELMRRELARGGGDLVR